MNLPVNTEDCFGEKLDQMLEHAYFRSGNRMFTLNSIYYDDQVDAGYYDVYWLRYDLKNLKLSKTLSRLERASAKFECDFQPFELTAEMEELYQRYSNSTKFSQSKTLETYLYHDYPINENSKHYSFNSYVLTIRHQGKLIAAGITDLGKNAMSGIINIYDPTMRKYSLGKMLITLKLCKALEMQMDWFYPGYIVPGVPAFEYKTFIGTEYVQVWFPIMKIWITYDLFNRL